MTYPSRSATPPLAKAPVPPPPVGAPPWWKTLRADPPYVVRLGIGAGFVGFLFLVWWLVTRGGPTDAMISPSKLPSPSAVWHAMPALGDIDDDIWATVERVVKGIGCAAVVGIGLGVLAGSYRGVSAALQPLLIFLRSVPMGALLPLTVVAFGIEEKQKAMFIFLAVVPFVFSDTIKAISLVPQRYVETADTLGASRFQIIRKVLFPLALPDIITSLRFQFGLALGYITLAEAVNMDVGLGKLINTAQREFNAPRTYALLFVIAFLAFGIDLLLRTLQRGLFPYRSDL